MSQESVVVVDVEEPSASSQFEDQRGDSPSRSSPAMSQEGIVVVDASERLPSPSASSQEERDYFNDDVSYSNFFLRSLLFLHKAGINTCLWS